MGQLKMIPLHFISRSNIGNCLVVKKFSADNYNFYGALLPFIAFCSCLFFFLVSVIAGQEVKLGRESEKERRKTFLQDSRLIKWKD